jgi:hypothetical protein
MSDLTKRLRTPERTISRCRNLLYVSAETAVEAANEIDRLAAQVERLRMTREEREAIADCADAAEAYMNDDIATTLRALNDRHARETVAE